MDTYGLIADIGGTNARFATVENGTIGRERVLSTQGYDTLTDAIAAYREMEGIAASCHAAAIALAGPVRGDWFEMTNFKWKFSISETGKALGIPFFTVINDFKAVALAVPNLKPADYRKIGRLGQKVTKENMVVVGPGTGLGSAGIVYEDGTYIAVPSESQHAPLGARAGDAREEAVFAEIMRLHPDYTELDTERVCSGKGLVNLYDAIRSLNGQNAAPVTPEEVTVRALSGNDPQAREALDIMMRMLGRFAATLALTFSAFGGAYIAGGITLKLGDYFESSPFRESFDMGGHFNGFTLAIPTYQITAANPAFIGLASLIPAA